MHVAQLKLCVCRLSTALGQMTKSSPKKTPKFECTIALFGQSSPWGDAAKRSKVKCRERERGRKGKRESEKNCTHTDTHTPRRAADKLQPYPFLNEVPHHLAEAVKFSQLATQSHCKRIGNMAGQQQGQQPGRGRGQRDCAVGDEDVAGSVGLCELRSASIGFQFTSAKSCCR